MSDPGKVTDAPVAADPAAVLDAVLAGIGRTGTDVLSVLRPVLGADGAVVDFEVVADTGMLARLAGAPSVGRRVRALLPADLAQRLVSLGGEAHRTGAVGRGDLALSATADGLVPAATVVDDRHLHVGEVLRIPSEGLLLLMGRDVTEARAARRALLASEQRYRRLVEHSSDPILVLTAGGVITYASPAVRVVLHTEPDVLLGRPLSAITHPDDAPACRALLADVVAARAGASRTARLRTTDTAGAVAWLAVTATNWVDDAAVAGVVLNVRDVTDQRAAELRLQQEALQDSLTGLANRRRFLRALEEAVSRSGRTGAPFAVLVLDVDDFKAVNDSLGHPAGDALLADLARRLTSALRPSDTAARLGGDEFVVIAEGLHSADDAMAVARRVLDRCSGGYRVGGVDEPVRATVSIGVATSVDRAVDAAGTPGAAGPLDGGPGSGMFRRADAALYRAKRLGRNRIEPDDGPRVAVPS